MCALLPGLHALTGCDSTSGFFAVGKVKPLKWAWQNLDIALHFQALGTYIEVKKSTQSIVSILPTI